MAQGVIRRLACSLTWTPTTVLHPSLSRGSARSLHSAMAAVQDDGNLRQLAPPVDVQEGDGNCSLPPVAMEQREARGCSLQGMEFNSIEERRCQR